MRMAVSSCRAFRSNRSRAVPGGSVSATLRSSSASWVSRSSRSVCDTATLLHALLRSWRKAGAQLAFSSPIKAKYRAVIKPNAFPLEGFLILALEPMLPAGV